MKIFLSITLLIQLMLIGCSTYYGTLADGELDKLATASANEIIRIADQFHDYDKRESVFGYAAGVVWLLVVVVVNVRKATHTLLAQLALYLPILVGLVLDFI